MTTPRLPSAEHVLFILVWWVVAFWALEPFLLLQSLVLR